MKKSNEKLRYILQYYYDKGKNVAQACEKICAVYGEVFLSKSAARKWFARFRSGNFNVKDESRSGRPITEKADEILEKVQQDKHISSVDIGMELDIDHKTVLNHLHKAGYKKKLDVWVPHELSAKNMIDRSKQRPGTRAHLGDIAGAVTCWSSSFLVLLAATNYASFTYPKLPGSSLSRDARPRMG
ncbi:Histone-lysine N-methyltransferase SETMAR [Anthophora plagiata]